MRVHIEQQLADHMQRVLKAKKWSLRQAEIQTGIKFSTIYNMSVGKKVGPEYIIDWAKAISEDVADWLGYAGYTDMAGIVRGEPSPPPYPEPAPELTREPFLDDEEEELVGFYRGAPPEDKEALRAMIRALRAKERRREEEE